MASVNVSPAAVLRLPVDSPVRRLAVRLAAQDALHEEKTRCECGQEYLAVGRPAVFFDLKRQEQRFTCRTCSRVL